MVNYDQIAKVYDIFYNSATFDIQFYLSEAKKVRGPVLEVACGTGRVYLRLLEAGVDAYGIDLSKGMLSALEKKAAARGLKPKVKLADMRNFRLNKKFSLIIVPFRSFLHLLTIDDQLAALKCFRKHLAKGGKLALNFFYPSREYISKDYGREVPRIKQNGVEWRDFSVFEDEPDQIVKSSSRAIKNGRTIKRWEFKIAFIYKREFELLLRLAGFSKWRVYGGFKKERLTSSNQEMVWIIEK